MTSAHLKRIHIALVIAIVVALVAPIFGTGQNSLLAAPAGAQAQINGITSPVAGAILRGSVSIQAVATLPDFRKWQLDLIAKDGTDHASWLANGDAPVDKPAEIFTLDTTQYADGNYDLRLRVVHNDTNYQEYVTPVTLANSQPVNAVSPVLLATTPPNGAAWDGSPVSFTFDRPMAAAKITVAPSLAGDTTIDGAKVIFTPTGAPVPNTLYRFTIPEGQAQDGAQLAYAAQLSVQAVGPLTVSATQPADGAEESDPLAPITVMFNRPVVPLTGAEEQASLPQPLTFDPAVEGAGQWISTSVYQFQPASPLAGATTYAVTVDALTDVAGEKMTAPYTFHFTTAAPIVLSASPSGIFVPPATKVRVTFSQPMDPSSTAAAFALTTGGGKPIAGDLTWNITNTTFVFTPTVALDYGATYKIAVAQSALPASQQGNLRQAYSSEFTVVPLPAVASTTIDNGAEAVNPENELRIRFTAPVSQATVLNNIQISPLLTSTNVVSYTYTDYYENTNQNTSQINTVIPPDYGTHLMLNWYKEPNTAYTVTIGSGVTDQFGNTMAEPYVLNFTTGDFAPMVQLDLDRFTHYSAFTTTVVGVKYRNVDSVDAELYRLPLADLYQLGGENQYQIWDQYQVPNPEENRIWSKSAPADGPRNVVNILGFKLVDADGNPLPPGVYLLEVQDPFSTPMTDSQGNPVPAVQKAVIILTNYDMTIKRGTQGNSLAWLTDLRSGQPIAGAPVEFTRNGDTLGKATTDADGIAMAPLDMSATTQYYSPVVFATSGEPGADDFAVVSSGWSQGIEPWSFNLNTSSPSDQMLINLYTERPIYRPGQTVYWKGIIRTMENDVWALPEAGQSFTIRINDAFGKILMERAYTTNAFGTINGEFTLAPDAPTGYYGLYTEVRAGDITVASGNANFVVAAYVKPEFQIDVKTDKPFYIQGETIKVNVQANYFSGSPLAGAPVEWRLVANPYFFTWTKGPEDRYYSFEPYDPSSADYNPYNASNLGLVQDGAGVTNADGSFTLELPADLGNAIQSQLWSLDVTITSPTSQQVYNNITFPVHRGAYYIGLSPQSYVAEAGKPTPIDIVTVKPDGARYPNADLTVVVYEFQWSSVYARGDDGNYYWQSSAQRTPVYTTTTTTSADGTSTIDFTPARGGEYQVTAAGQDQDGNQVLSAVFVYAADAGANYVAWERENNDRIELIADKKLYAPGDTAKILIPNPFEGPVKALYTVERAGVIEAKVIELTGSSQTIDVPITSDYIPNIYVGIVIVKGIDDTNPFPATRVGYVQLPVDASEKALHIDIATSAAIVKPGDTVTYTLQITDKAGKPVANAETSVALVDKAVLVLGADYQSNQSMLDIFYYKRALGVTTGSLLVINKDRVSAQLAEGGKGGGGGGGGGGPEVRENFPDTAFWRADLVSDANGQIQFAVKLPDNLTTWVLTAKGVTKDTLVGEATNEVVATKELQVRPALPRFFTAGDHAVIGGVVLNTSQESLQDGTFAIAVEGATLDEQTGNQSFSLEPGAQTIFNFPIRVDDAASTVVVTMTATAGDFADGVRMTMPVLRYQSPETMGTSGEVPATGVTEAIYVPQAATNDGQLRITLDPSLAAGMLAGLSYLDTYPYACNEQTVSRFLPNLFTLKALQNLGIDDKALQAQLDEQLTVEVQSLISRQNPDGGWGFWPQEESSPFITAYVLWGLWNANEAGYTVTSSIMDQAAQYLDGQFKTPDQVTQSWQLNEMAFMHYVLATTGHGDPGRASTLYDVRERLASYGKAFLAMALDLMDKNDARIQTLLDDLVGSAVLTASGASWQDTPLDVQTMATDVRSTAIVLDAFLQIQPDQQLLPNVVRWLMAARADGRWSTTQENAWSIIALSDWMQYTGELQANYDWKVTLNDETLGQGRFISPADTTVLTRSITDLLRDQANLLAFSRSAEPGKLYYSTYLSYNVDALAVQPLDRGMVIERQFFMDGKPVNTVAAGDVVSVVVTIVAPNDLYHVQVEAPIPAGTEPLDPSLPTGFQYNDQGGPVLKPTNAAAGGWYNWIPASLDYRDDRVAMFATYLPAGSYQYTFQVRAALPGEYRVLPAHGEMMYFPEVWGRSAGAQFTITK